MPPRRGDVWRHHSGGPELHVSRSCNTLDGAERVWALGIGKLHDGFMDSTSFYESAFTDGTLTFVRSSEPDPRTAEAPASPTTGGPRR